MFSEGSTRPNMSIFEVNQRELFHILERCIICFGSKLGGNGYDTRQISLLHVFVRLFWP